MAGAPVLLRRINCTRRFMLYTRFIMPIHVQDVQRVSSKATMVVREEVLPIRSLASLIGWEENSVPTFGVLMQCTTQNFILAIDSFIGQANVVIKSLHDIKPKGVAGATLTGDGTIVLVLDIEQFSISRLMKQV